MTFKKNATIKYSGISLILLVFLSHTSKSLGADYCAQVFHQTHSIFNLTTEQQMKLKVDPRVIEILIQSMIKDRFVYVIADGSINYKLGPHGFVEYITSKSTKEAQYQVLSQLKTISLDKLQEELKLKQDQFEFIKKNNLNNIEQLQATLDKNTQWEITDREWVSFPKGSEEIVLKMQEYHNIIYNALNSKSLLIPAPSYDPLLPRQFIQNILDGRFYTYKTSEEIQLITLKDHIENQQMSYNRRIELELTTIRNLKKELTDLVDDFEI